MCILVAGTMTQSILVEDWITERGHRWLNRNIWAEGNRVLTIQTSGGLSFSRQGRSMYTTCWSSSQTIILEGRLHPRQMDCEARNKDCSIYREDGIRQMVEVVRLGSRNKHCSMY